MRADTWSGAINYTQLRSDEVEELMERKLAQFKKGVIPHEERRKLAEDWSKDVDLDSLDATILAIEAESLAKRYEKMNMPALGHLEVDRPAGVYRWMYCQLNSASTEESRDEKTHEIKQLVDRYSVQGVVMCEHCTNFGNMRSSRRLASWFNGDRAVKAIEAWNKHVTEGPHLPGGTGMIGMFELYKVMRTSNVDF